MGIGQNFQGFSGVEANSIQIPSKIPQIPQNPRQNITKTLQNVCFAVIIADIGHNILPVALE